MFESLEVQMQRVLIVYSTTDGHTVRICERLRQAIEPSGAQVRLVSVSEANGVDLGAYEKIVVGASPGVREGQRAASDRFHAAASRGLG